MRVWTEPGWAAQAIAGHVGLPQAAWIEQIHSDIVLPVTAGGFAGQGDGLVTATPGVALVGRSADCPLILLADVEAGVVGMAHASWRGTVQLIARRMVEAAVQLGGRPERMVACICPSAGPCCYEVGPDVLAAAVAGIGPEAERFFAPENGDWLLFRRLKKAPVPDFRKWKLDLWTANRWQLEQSGLAGSDTHAAGVCTMCRNDLFPSHRKEADRAGRFMAMIGLAP